MASEYFLCGWNVVLWALSKSEGQRGSLAGGKSFYSHGCYLYFAKCVIEITRDCDLVRFCNRTGSKRSRFCRARESTKVWFLVSFAVIADYSRESVSGSVGNGEEAWIWSRIVKTSIRLGCKFWTSDGPYGQASLALIHFECVFFWSICVLDYLSLLHSRVDVFTSVLFCSRRCWIV